MDKKLDIEKIQRINACSTYGIGMDFGVALSALKAGHKLARKGWNGRGLFVYLVKGGKYDAQMDCIKKLADENGKVEYEPYFAIWNGRGTINTWVPSVSDLLATDWQMVEIEEPILTPKREV